MSMAALNTAVIIPASAAEREISSSNWNPSSSLLSLPQAAQGSALCWAIVNQW